jgi:hypothetical protein
MNRKLETDVQELALAVINNNSERAARLIRRLPQDVIEKVAYGAIELFGLTLQHLPDGTAAAIKRSVVEKEKAASAKP